MFYKNRKTGDKFLHLATAQNIETMKNQIVFCPNDSENSIYTMLEDKFHSEYEAVAMIEKAAWRGNRIGVFLYVLIILVSKAMSKTRLSLRAWAGF